MVEAYRLLILLNLLALFTIFESLKSIPVIPKKLPKNINLPLLMAIRPLRIGLAGIRLKLKRILSIIVLAFLEHAVGEIAFVPVHAITTIRLQVILNDLPFIVILS